METASDAALKMLSAALEKEEKGREFYVNAADKCSNPLSKDLFRMLVTEEGIHIKRIKGIFASLSAGNSRSEEWKPVPSENEDLHALVKSRIAQLGPKVSSDSTDLEAIDVGIEMEQGAIDFYEQQAKKTTDSLEKSFITMMLAEERNHFAALRDLKLFFTDPESWFIEKEKPALEG